MQETKFSFLNIAKLNQNNYKIQKFVDYDNDRYFY